MISVAKLQAAVPAAVGKDEALLQDMIARAQALIESVTRRYFGEPEHVTEILAGTGTYHLRLQNYADMDSDDDVSEWDRPGGTEVVIPVEDIDLRAGANTTYLARLDGEVWRLDYEYHVPYTRGYVVDDGPPDVEGLILDLLAMKLNTLGKEGLASETIGGYSYTRPAIYAFDAGDLKQLPGAMAVIKAWQHRVFA